MTDDNKEELATEVVIEDEETITVDGETYIYLELDINGGQVPSYVHEQVFTEQLI